MLTWQVTHIKPLYKLAHQRMYICNKITKVVLHQKARQALHLSPRSLLSFPSVSPSQKSYKLSARSSRICRQRTSRPFTRLVYLGSYGPSLERLLNLVHLVLGILIIPGAGRSEPQDIREYINEAVARVGSSVRREKVPGDVKAPALSAGTRT